MTINFQVEGSQCLQVICDLSPDVDPIDCMFSEIASAKLIIMNAVQQLIRFFPSKL